MTSESICPTVYCPAPDDAAWHRCFVCQRDPVHHHHVRPRGMGGSASRKMDKAGVVALCPSHHEAVTLHNATDGIADFPGRGRVYFYLDDRGNTIAERSLEAEAGPIEPGAASVLASSGSMGLSFDQWRKQGRRLAAALRAAPWAIGDWLVGGERLYGQDQVWQTVDELKMDYATLRNYQRVAEKFPAALFPREYPWSWYREVAALAPDSALSILAEAAAGGEGRAGVVTRRKEIEGVSVTKAVGKQCLCCRETCQATCRCWKIGG